MTHARWVVASDGRRPRPKTVQGDAVLGSTVVQAGKERALKFELDFEPIFNPGAIVPCGLRLIVGPNVGDRELLSLDVAATTYEFEKKAPSESRARKA